MAVDSPRARTERALAELVATEGPRAVTVARIRAAARVDQSVAADVVRQWRRTQRVGATDEVAAPATEDEARAFEALRAIIRQAVLAERAKQDEAVNQAASAATEEAEETRQEATLLAEDLEKEKALTAEQATTIAALKAELAAAAAEADRLRDEVAQQREVAGAAREEAAETRGNSSSTNNRPPHRLRRRPRPLAQLRSGSNPRPRPPRAPRKRRDWPHGWVRRPRRPRYPWRAPMRLANHAHGGA